jgi:transposase
MFSLGLGKRRLEQQLAQRDQRIAELEQQLREQAAKRDQRIAELEQQQREQTAKRDQRIAEIEQQLQEQATKRDQRIAELEQQAQQLLRELEEWRRGHRRRGKRYPARKKPASEKKRPGREPGHPGAGRPLPRPIDRYHDCSLGQCPNCKSNDLHPTGHQSVTRVEEVVPARREVIGYRQYEYDCGGCHQRPWSSLPPELGPSPKLGIRALELALSLRYEYRLSLGQICRYLKQHVGLEISKGGLWQMLHRAAQRTAKGRQEILEVARSRALVHMDETGLRVQGTLWWLWFAGDVTFSYFHLDPSRGHEVVWLLLGKDFAGLVVCDFMGAYTAAGLELLRCWAHLMREAERVADVSPSEQTTEFYRRLQEVYKQALLAQHTQLLEDRYAVWRALGRLVSDEPLGGHAEVARLQGRIDRHVDELLRFLELRTLPGTNNLAEQDLRPAVQMRHVMFCLRSPSGADTFSHWMSITQTLRKLERPLLPYLRESLAAHFLGSAPPSLFGRELPDGN